MSLRSLVPDRGAVAVLAPIAAVLTVVGVAAYAARQPDGPPHHDIPSGVAVNLPWAMAALSVDEHHLDVGVLHPSEPPGCRAFLPQASVEDRPDLVTITVTATLMDTTCGQEGPTTRIVTVSLPTALGQRPVVDGHNGAARPVLPQRVLPHPTYPAPSSALVHGPATAAGDRLVWAVSYPADPVIAVDLMASRTRRTPQGERVAQATVQGREVSIYLTPKTDRGRAYVAAWREDGGWQLELMHGWGPQQKTPGLDEFRRVLDGLRWP
jgi:hypothetical protein